MLEYNTMILWLTFVYLLSLSLSLPLRLSFCISDYENWSMCLRKPGLCCSIFTVPSTTMAFPLQVLYLSLCCFCCWKFFLALSHPIITQACMLFWIQIGVLHSSRVELEFYVDVLVADYRYHELSNEKQDTTLSLLSLLRNIPTTQKNTGQNLHSPPTPTSSIHPFWILLWHRTWKQRKHFLHLNTYRIELFQGSN